MKFWNKQKEYRRLHWKTVPPPPIEKMYDAKRWCQANDSSGKFYFHFTNTRWWFEKEEDALLFSLTWSNHVTRRI